MHEDIKTELNSGIALYHSVQNILSSRLIRKNIQFKILNNYNFACCLIWV
jgi:hypothetical protein